MKFIFYTLILFAQPLLASELISSKRLDGTEIHYYLTRPYGHNKFGIVLVTGAHSCSTPNIVKPKDDLFIKNSFARLQIEKLDIPFGTDKCSPAYLEKNSIESDIFDVLKVIHEIRKEPRWNHELHLVGEKEGAVLASMLATYIPETKKLVLMGNGGGLTYKENLILTTRSQLAKLAKNNDEIEKEINKIESEFKEILLNPVSSRFWRNEKNTFLWLSSILNLRPLEYLFDLNIPILLMHGDQDSSISVETSRIVDNQFKLKDKKNLIYKEYKGLDQFWNNQKKENKVKDIWIDLVSWLRQK